MAYKDKNNPTMVPCSGYKCNVNSSCCKGTNFVIDPSERLCNQCGFALKEAIDKNDFQSDYGLRDVQVEAGYFSNYLTDWNQYIFSLCEKCLRDLFIRFKIKPDIYCHSDNVGYSWEEDNEGIEERLWHRSEGPKEKYKQQLCNERQHCPYRAVYSLFYVADDGDTFANTGVCIDHSERYVGKNSYKLVPFISHKLIVFI